MPYFFCRRRRYLRRRTTGNSDIRRRARYNQENESADVTYYYSDDRHQVPSLPISTSSTMEYNDSLSLYDDPRLLRNDFFVYDNFDLNDSPDQEVPDIDNISHPNQLRRIIPRTPDMWFSVLTARPRSQAIVNQPNNSKG